MEYWDLYDKDKNKLNKTVKRGDYLSDDEYHLVVNAWIMNDKNEFLISQRSSNKKHPLMWECTGGSALMGEDSLEAAKREVLEELGLDFKAVEGIFVGSTLRYYEGCPDILDVLLFKYNCDVSDVTIQVEEVNCAKWVSKEELKTMCQNGEFDKNAYFDEIMKWS